MPFEELSRYEPSLEFYAQALKLFRELKNQEGEGKTLTRTGGVYYYLSQFDKAREYCEQSLTISREVKTDGMNLRPLPVSRQRTEG